MRIRGIKTARRMMWSLRGRLLGGGVVLGYHRVAIDPGDPWDLCVAPATFDRHMAILRRDFEPVALAALDGGRVPRGRKLPVAVTFDDGYEDLLTEALPALERHEIPATAFIVGSALEGVFWWDRLHSIVEGPHELPTRLDLAMEGVRLQWQAEQGRRALRGILHGALLAMRAPDRDQALPELARWAGVADAPPPASDLLDADQLRRLGDHPLMEIGSHTMTHPDLRMLDVDELVGELRGSRDRLAELVGREIESFSYPHGLFGPTAVREVARAGYLRACTSSSGLVHAGTDPYLVPRLWAPLRDEVDFRAWLRGWTGH